MTWPRSPTRPGVESETESRPPKSESSVLSTRQHYHLYSHREQQMFVETASLVCMSQHFGQGCWIRQGQNCPLVFVKDAGLKAQEIDSGSASFFGALVCLSPMEGPLPQI